MSTATVSNPNAAVLDAVRKVTTLATLPEITAKIIQTVEDPKSSASRLHKIVSHDPALVTRILKVVNSAFYGLPGQIGSIERAIVLLGLNAVKNIAVAASLGQLFRGVKLCDGFTAKDLWKHCIAVAVTSRELAKELHLPLGDEAFLAGMIHDVGILISLQLSPEKLQKVCEKVKTTGADFCETERELIGTDHQQLGAALAEVGNSPGLASLWPGITINLALSAMTVGALVSLVYVADTLCCHAASGFNLTAIRQTMEDPAVAELAIDDALIERTATRLPELVEAASAMG